jgi:hypothetical protein
LALKDAKTIYQQLSGARNRQKPLGWFYGFKLKFLSSGKMERTKIAMVRTALVLRILNIT